MSHRRLAPEKKYFRSKPSKKTTMVLLLLKDDERKYLTPTQRSDLLVKVEKEYKKAKLQQKIDKLPKYNIKSLPTNLSADELITAIKQKRVVGL